MVECLVMVIGKEHNDNVDHFTGHNQNDAVNSNLKISQLNIGQ